MVREGLRFAVAGKDGTAEQLARPQYNIPQPAGKTGTAQYGTPDAKGNFPTHAWFTAVAPVTDPEVAVTVFIEAGGEGASYAEPVAARI